MKKAAAQIAVLAMVLLLVCVAHRWISGNRYTSFVPVRAGAFSGGGFTATADAPGRIEIDRAELRGEYARVSVRPRERGEALIHIADGAGGEVAAGSLRVGPFMTVYDPRTGGFSGDTAVVLAFTVFCFCVALIMLRWFRRLRWTAFYSYNSIYAAGFAIFALLTGVLMGYVSIRHLLSPAEYPMLNAYREISLAAWQFMALTAPLMLAFAVALTVSNIALLRHERPRLQNALGILLGLLLVAGEALAWRLYRGDGRPGSRAVEIFREVYATGFVYFECMLAGAVICGVKAARHRPDYDRDYIIVLGCRFRRDGTLPPLLRGRVDAAIEFWKAQRAATGKRAVLIPSGGQGDDETMAEAEAMRRYMVSQGVPESAVRIEDRSRNTYQNMAFSREIIEREKPGAAVAYATTNYHVFRSGVWAALAGLPAEGIGGRTKWWFWPNAFIRECLGLLKNRWKQELGLMIATIGFFLALSAVLTG